MFPIKDLIRPFFGLILIQPIVLIWLFLTREHPLEEYISVGWGLQLLISLWLIPVYYYYEKMWDCSV